MQPTTQRVATLVARCMSPGAGFGAVTAETGGALGAEITAVVRIGDDGTAAVAGSWKKPGAEGLVLRLRPRGPGEEEAVGGHVAQPGDPRHLISYQRAVESASDWARENGIRLSADSPIVVDGRLWGAIIAFSHLSAADLGDTEERLLPFAELAALAIASAESRAQLVASRRRVVAAADQTRLRIEHDLHQTQQRLISLALELRAAESAPALEQRSIGEQWARTAQGLTDVVEQLREISRSVYPATLDESGLRPALRGLARRASVPVELDTDLRERLPKHVEIAAYYVVSEALANAAKHARASAVKVDAGVVGDDLRLQVRDDGVGGADASRGAGIIGLADRVEAVGGQLEIRSPARGGTTVLATIPLTSP